MAHGENAVRKHDEQWWSRRPHGMHVINSKDGNKFMKRQVHKIERQGGKRYVRFHKIMPEELEASRSKAWKYLV